MSWTHEELKAWRLRLGLTVEQAARIVRLEASSMKSLLNGRRAIRRQVEEDAVAFERQHSCRQKGQGPRTRKVPEEDVAPLDPPALSPVVLSEADADFLASLDAYEASCRAIVQTVHAGSPCPQEALDALRVARDRLEAQASQTSREARMQARRRSQLAGEAVNLALEVVELRSHRREQAEAERVATVVKDYQEAARAVGQAALQGMDTAELIRSLDVVASRVNATCGWVASKSVAETTQRALDIAHLVVRLAKSPAQATVLIDEVVDDAMIAGAYHGRHLSPTGDTAQTLVGGSRKGGWAVNDMPLVVEMRGGSAELRAAFLAEIREGNTCQEGPRPKRGRKR